MNAQVTKPARGGKRPGAGRKKGSLTKRTREIAEKAAEEGITPLEVMLDNMRFHHSKAERLLRGLLQRGVKNAEDLGQAVETFRQVCDSRVLAQNAAKDAAPFIHPRLQSIAHTGPAGGAIPHEHIHKFADFDKLKPAELAALYAALASGDPATTEAAKRHRAGS